MASKIPLDFVRAINAAKKFKIKDDAEFIEFNDVSDAGVTEDDPIPDQMEIWSAVKIWYEGEIPESYKSLNLIIGDWVEQHEEKLTKMIHNELKRHFKEKYPNTDASELDEEGEASSIWLDQLDYMPLDNPNEKSMVIEIELVMDVEPC